MFCNVFCRAKAEKQFHFKECQAFDSQIPKHIKNPSDAIEYLKMLHAILKSIDAFKPQLIAHIPKNEDLKTCTIFDYDLSQAGEMTDMSKLRIVFEMKQHAFVSNETLLGVTASLFLHCFPCFSHEKTREQQKFMLDYAMRLMRIRFSNSYYFVYKQIEGSGILLFGSLLNHSCDPNTVLISFENKIACIVTKPIKKGEQIFRNYR